MTYLKEGRFCMGVEGRGEIIRINEYLPLIAPSLLHHTKNSYFSRISFSLDHSSVS